MESSYGMAIAQASVRLRRAQPHDDIHKQETSMKKDRTSTPTASRKLPLSKSTLRRLEHPEMLAEDVPNKTTTSQCAASNTCAGGGAR
jgi:hypothetical protein